MISFMNILGPATHMDATRFGARREEYATTTREYAIVTWMNWAAKRGEFACGLEVPACPNGDRLAKGLRTKTVFVNIFHLAKLSDLDILRTNFMFRHYI